MNMLISSCVILRIWLTLWIGDLVLYEGLHCSTDCSKTLRLKASGLNSDYHNNLFHHPMFPHYPWLTADLLAWRMVHVCADVFEHRYAGCMQLLAACGGVDHRCQQRNALQLSAVLKLICTRNMFTASRWQQRVDHIWIFVSFLAGWSAVRLDLPVSWSWWKSSESARQVISGEKLFASGFWYL